MSRRRSTVSVLAAVLITAFVTVVILNLSSGEKKVSHRIAPAYAVGEAPFLRSMGSLLGPPLLRGNQVVALRNGREIFPAMLAAIEAARFTITFETFIGDRCSRRG